MNLANPRRRYDPPRDAQSNAAVTTLAPASWWRGLGGLTRSGSSIEALAWTFYDFANTMFSFAIVSFAMSLWTIRFLGEGPGTFWFTAAVSVSVLLNAIVSPVLGAMSDRIGRRKPFLAVFTAICLVGTLSIGLVDIRLGLVAFAIANLPTRVRSSTTTRCCRTSPARSLALGYCGTLLISYGIIVSTLLSSLGRDAYRVAIASLFVLLLIGIWILRGVPEDEPASEEA